MNEEQWLPIPEFEKFYEVSDHGRVRRIGFFFRPVINGKEYWIARNRAPKLLRLKFHKPGYLRLALRKDGKYHHFLVHQLVALAFLGPTPSGCEIHHKDVSFSNNHVSNLAWVTRQEHKRLHKQVT